MLFLIQRSWIQKLFGVWDSELWAEGLELTDWDRRPETIDVHAEFLENVATYLSPKP